MQSFTNTNFTAGGNVTNVNIRLQDTSDADPHRLKLIEWLSPINFFTRHQDIISRRQEGTGEWLLYSDEFKHWEANSGSVLWCSGAPGVGKTMLASIAVEYLRSKQDSEIDIGVAVMYCDYKERDMQSPINLMASLWRQLVLHRPISSSVEILHKRHREPCTRPSLKKILDVLKSVAHELSKVFIVVDGLDECPEDDDVRQILLTSLQEIQPNVHLMFTSRPHVTIAPDFPEPITLEIRANDEDMKNYIDARMKGRSLAKVLKGHIELQNEIRTKIVEISDGMFLLVQLHMDALSTKYNRKDVRDALSTLPESLDRVYDQAMERINNQNDDHKKLGQRVLIWLSYAFVPFSVEMLQEAVSVNLGDTDLDDDSLPNEEILLSVCAGLVAVHKQDDTVRLVHFTTQKYLERVRERHFPDPASYIAATCITYLSFDKFANSRPQYANQHLLPMFPPSSFLDYAQGYWAIHSRAAEQRIATLIRTFIFARLDSLKTWLTGAVPSRCTPIWVAASFNLEGTVHQLLEEVEDTNWQEEGNLLFVASDQGYESLVKLLLDRGTSVNAAGEHGTALYACAMSGLYYPGAYNMAQLLLSKGADVDAQGGNYGTPLQAASYFGFEHIVNLLLENGANVNLLHGMFGTALHAACQGNQERIVELLLGKGANVRLVAGDFTTPLHAVCAVRYHDIKQLDVINLLVEKGADINTKGGKYGTALQAASYRGNQRAVHLLLQKGADVNAECGEYGTALQAAVISATSAATPLSLNIRGVIKLLLEYDADVNLRAGKYGNSALIAALYSEPPPDGDSNHQYHAIDNQLVRQLFLHGADFGDLLLELGLDNDLRARVAWITAHEDVVRTLFETLEEDFSLDSESSNINGSGRNSHECHDHELHLSAMSRLERWNCNEACLNPEALTIDDTLQAKLATCTNIELQGFHAVVADILLLNEDHSRPTNLGVHTDGRQYLVLSLLSAQSSEGLGASFSVTVRTHASWKLPEDLEVYFSTAPVHSLLHIDAQTYRGDILLHLPPAYEGSFWLESQAGRVLIEHSGAEDPSGKGRKRTSKIRRIGSDILQGIVYWEPFDIDRPMGWVNAQSVYRSVKVIL